MQVAALFSVCCSLWFQYCISYIDDSARNRLKPVLRQLTNLVVSYDVIKGKNSHANNSQRFVMDLQKTSEGGRPLIDLHQCNISLWTVLTFKSYLGSKFFPIWRSQGASFSPLLGKLTPYRGYTLTLYNWEDLTVSLQIWWRGSMGYCPSKAARSGGELPHNRCSPQNVIVIEFPSKLVHFNQT